ncbi:MAG: glucoamylase family protein [Acidobacteriaceae bacterium]
MYKGARRGSHLLVTRRQMLGGTAGAAGFALLSSLGCGGGAGQQTPNSSSWPPSLPVGVFAPSATDNAFLDALEQQGCLYFWEQASPTTGQVLDHAAIDLNGQMDTSTTESSIAATGFGLTALCIADQRGYLPNVTHAQIVARVQTTLNFYLNSMPHENGFFYHFNDVNTGQPLAGSEVSCMDTAWLLCGVLTARAYFNDATITSLATQLYERVNWPWMLNGGTTFAMAWYPPTDPNPGFSSSRYDTFCELMALYLLAMGSPTFPIPASSWNRFSRPILTYEGYSYISSDYDPLFTQQYSQAWFDFRNQSDAYANYFTNSITATQASETFCLSYPQWYTEDYWGITSSNSINGYVAWGGPPAQGPIDGTVVPCAAAGSLPFLPNECLICLESLKANYGAQAWARYGFCDAFHPAANWYSPTSLGIDLGISVLMAENLRTGLVWSIFMSNPEAAQAMQLAGFKAT